jgi:epoxyqueuosine reductase
MHQPSEAAPAALPTAPALRAAIAHAARQLGLDAIGVSEIQLDEDERHLQRWLERGWHGQMSYMARHGRKRSRPGELVPGTLRVISARMNYRARHARDPDAVLREPETGYVSRYALGRDYHKVMRKALKRLAAAVAELAGPHGYRVFVDSAPVLEKALARNAGLGWIGKHTNLIDRAAGSYFFIGEIYLSLALPVDEASTPHCGTCSACLPACPTGAIVAPYRLDARRCISYLTIELAGSIPLELRHAIGNRIYGCDDCQLVCPWNKFARATVEKDFEVRNGLDRAALVDVFAWSEAEFLEKTRGSAIRRIGFERWLRNVAVALGNAPTSPEVIAALKSRSEQPSALVREHVAWALAQHNAA